MPKEKSIIWTMSKEDFANIVKSALCIRDIVEALGFTKTSGSMAIKVKRRIAQEGLDTSHLVGRNAKGSSNPQYKLKDILVENSTYTNLGRLKKRLVAEGVLKYECACCGNKGEWNGKPLSLQLDHKNGIPNDHRPVNIRFLCPNCHSQTENYSGKNAKKSK